jgi:hypothetical protein
MSRSAACVRAGQDRTSLYQEITDKIIAELEAGHVPWVTGRLLFAQSHFASIHLLS